MEKKKTIMFGMIIGSAMGGMIPSFWDSSMLSIWGIIFTAIGGFLGIWAGFELGD